MTASSSQQEPAEAVTTTAGGYTRLHITPFDPDLLRIILPSAILPTAKDISYHSLQTFPEQRYGFVNLPAADADKIRKKLNGATLRGAKVRIEPARPDDYMARSSERLQDDPAQDRKEERKKHKREKKRKRDYSEIPGVELEEGRKVKRGWTVSADSHTNRRDRKKEKDKNKDKGEDKQDKARKKELKRSKEIKSRYSDGPECLVKTRLPPNRTSLAGTADDETDAKKKRKKSKGGKEVLVHEFEKTTKFPTFLKQSQSSSSTTAPTEFVDGKGWVDADGNIVEVSRSTRPAVPNRSRPSKKASPELDDDETSSSGSSSSDDEEENTQSEDSSVEHQEDDTVFLTKDRLDTIPDATMDVDATSPQSDFKSDAVRPKSSGSARSLTIKIPPATPAAQKVHPLEALYKRAKPGDDATAITSDAQPFSFFGDEDQEDEEDSAPRASQIPMTPFTQQEFEWRNIRSAAPTPDTAHANKTFKFWSGGDGDDNVDEEEEDDTNEYQQRAADLTEEGIDTFDDNDTDKVPTDPSTNFQKWFWEHRGDLNRSWKKRRKMAAKEKRYRENRARADRAI
ncbi:putative suppressor protein srp40 protein [Phaeoacremonium minimum UCRPA7]|uniref:Putative suppressor protein srp40 protein n=1 Tax=Phaeoacremonium minimum (strain UCR-PA7) TaxID=1286976 RepID=R8BEI7_PHAM7|nr:putative suppressor protein srp40 protein [Phaeoacremonium minimum UCRPA7]EON97724.1 putative suppressor protein srp40 protein [Phaeoacremonium minimum UCRPA7]